MEELSELPGVLVRQLSRNEDSRGWLTELYREDENPGEFTPAMAYISITRPGVARGPHEHAEQTDGFAFLSGSFKLYLWENREGKGDANAVLEVGEANPTFVHVPPGVVHAYKNVGAADAFVLNFPDRLYAGWGKAETVDEFRHEEDAGTRFRLD